MGSECSESKRFLHVFPWVRRGLHILVNSSLTFFPTELLTVLLWFPPSLLCVCCFPQNTQEKVFFFLSLLRSIEYGSDLDNSLQIDWFAEDHELCGNSICSVVACGVL